MANFSMGLEAYRGQNRVLLVFAPSAQDAAYMKQRRLFEEATAGLAERDLRVFYLTYDELGEAAATLRRQFSIGGDAFAVVLIGKDGGDKERFSEPVQPQKLFGIIDQMPMRRREMKAGS